jgi:ribosome maturation factor RimP
MTQDKTSTLQADIEERLARAEPAVEVVLVELLGGHTVRLFIDHPDGVSLALCERVTGHLATVRESYALEVSSPGSDRPLTKPDHFRRFLGRRARVRLRSARRAGGAAARRSVSGELVGAGDAEVTLAADDGIVSIPYSDILRSNLVPGE